MTGFDHRFAKPSLATGAIILCPLGVSNPWRSTRGGSDFVKRPAKRSHPDASGCTGLPYCTLGAVSLHRQHMIDFDHN